MPTADFNLVNTPRGPVLYIARPGREPVHVGVTGTDADMLRVLLEPAPGDTQKAEPVGSGAEEFPMDGPHRDLHRP